MLRRCLAVLFFAGSVWADSVFLGRMSDLKWETGGGVFHAYWPAPGVPDVVLSGLTHWWIFDVYTEDSVGSNSGVKSNAVVSQG